MKYGDRHPLEVACQKLAFARDARDRALLARKALDYTCERERLDPEGLSRKQQRPCWKATHVNAQVDGYGRVELCGYWDHAGGNEDNGDHALLWCGPCQLRQVAHLAYRKAVKAHGIASRSLWVSIRATAKRNGWAGRDGRLTISEMDKRRAHSPAPTSRDGGA